MNITVTTYINKEKLLTEKNSGNFFEEENNYLIEYIDKNKKNYKIIVDKNKDSVSIVKDNTIMAIKNKKTKTKYPTPYGVIDLETELIKVNKLEKNNFVQFEIDYKIHFSKIDSQHNTLKILIKNK